ANYAGTSELFGFSSAQFPARWWQVGTYAFVHSGLWHLAANMYALFLFGPRLENEWGTRRFMWFYALCGLGGVVAAAVFFRGGLLVGSSAGVLGVMAVYAMQAPEDEVQVFGAVSIRVWTFVVAVSILNLSIGILSTG